MRDYLISLALGVVEGLTEFLPVSSTAHLRIAEALLQIPLGTPYWKMYTIVIQLGAILAIVVLYWRTFAAVLAGLLRGDPMAIKFVRNIIIAFLPAAVIGVALHKKIEALLSQPKVVAVALIVGGIAILVVERFAPRGRPSPHGD